MKDWHKNRGLMAALKKGTAVIVELCKLGKIYSSTECCGAVGHDFQWLKKAGKLAKFGTSQKLTNMIADVSVWALPFVTFPEQNGTTGHILPRRLASTLATSTSYITLSQED